MTTRAIPTITNASDLKAYLKNYQQSLDPTVLSAPTPIAPYNFKVTSQRGGNLLSWSPLIYPRGSATNISQDQAKITKADGYEIQRSATGDFSPGKYTMTALRDPAQSSYFDDVGGASQTFYYRMRATNGTSQTPYTINGLFTMVLKSTSIDSSDVATQPVTTTDTFTNSTTQARARAWPAGVNSPWQ
jgi:hypothetical protein